MKKKIKGLIIVSVLAILLSIIPTTYNLVTPGVIEDISPMIEIENRSRDETGEVMLAAVTVRRARLMHLLYVSLFRPEFTRLEPIPEIDMDKYFELMQEMMQESQLTAKIVALEKAGYQPVVKADGAKIEDILDDFDATNKLKAGDVIIEVDGLEVELATDVQEKLRNKEVGEEILVTVLRDDEELNFEIITKALEDESDIPAIGVLITSYNREVELPVDVEIDAGKIGGPSAGSMFALEIYNQLTDEDITAGNKIAGTGSIDLNKNINRIDGVRQKIKAAADENVDYFFLPADNQEDITDFGTQYQGVNLVVVSNFAELLDYLNQL